MSLGDSGWVQISTADCWYKCGNKGGLCEDGCGSNGYCCKKGLDDCPSEAGEVSPIHHTCVRKLDSRENFLELFSRY